MRILSWKRWILPADNSMAAEKGVIWLLRAAMNLLYKVLSVD